MIYVNQVDFSFFFPWDGDVHRVTPQGRPSYQLFDWGLRPQDAEPIPVYLILYGSPDTVRYTAVGTDTGYANNCNYGYFIYEYEGHKYYVSVDKATWVDNGTGPQRFEIHMFGYSHLSFDDVEMD